MKKEKLALFTELLGLPELSVEKIKETSQGYELSVSSILKQGICPRCGKKSEEVKSYNYRKIKDLPIIDKRVILNLEVRQFECSCGHYYRERFSFVRARKHLTTRYERSLYYRSKGVDIKYLAENELLDWKTVQEIFDYYSQEEIGQRDDWEGVSHIGMDEIALKKGHKNYVVVVLDLLTGVILDILPQRDKAYLIQYFRDKGRVFCKQIKVFCSDMWSAYLNTAKELFTEAIVVADRFHFFSKCQDGLDHARKSLRKKFPKAEELKKLKWALLKNPDGLTDKQEEKLQAVFQQKQFHLLRLTWDARNALKDIFDTHLTKQQAEKEIDKWIEGVIKHKVRYLFKFVDFYTKWKEPILNYFQGRFSTGIIEGTNNKLKLIKRRAFGFLKFERFKARALVEFF